MNTTVSRTQARRLWQILVALTVACEDEAASTANALQDVAADTAPTCTTGTDGCACFSNQTCFDGLACTEGLCGAPPCTKGDDGCPCFGNGTCNDGLACEEDVCVAIPCENGTEGCPCLSDGTCGGVLVCSNAACELPACQAGEVGCSCAEGACDGELVCTNGQCAASTCDAGTLGCPCLGDGTCGGELVCKVNTCAQEDGIPCEAGSLGCPCDDGTCDGSLVCASGTCATGPSCPSGSVGCPCNGNACNGTATCDDNICRAPASCETGTLGCACLSNGLCAGSDLVCESKVCVQKPCTPGDEGCPCDSGACGAGLVCEKDVCVADGCEPGLLDCPCFDNGTCGAHAGVWLTCTAGVCKVPACPAGDDGCACLSGGICNAGLTCQGVGSAATCFLQAACPDGTAGCACDAGACESGSYCKAGLCTILGCSPGTIGCVCDGGECSDKGGACNASGWCEQATCKKGSEGCPCSTGNTCGVSTLAETLTCKSSLCSAPSCTPGATGCACIWGATCSDAGDSCVGGFCQPDDCAIGQLHCGCSGGACAQGLTCRDGAICADNTGRLGGPCYDDSTCDSGLLCSNGQCQLCQLGTEQCACKASSTCNSGLVCWSGHCWDDDAIELPPGTPTCWTPCESDRLGDDGSLVSCSSEGLMAGCFDNLVCNQGSCTLPGADKPACETDTGCPDFQVCIQGGCYSNCDTDADCDDSDSCVKKVCKTPCLSTAATCGSGATCVSTDGTNGWCETLVSAGDASDTSPPPTYELSAQALEFTNVSTTAKLKITNLSQTKQTFTVRKRDHALYTDAGMDTEEDADDTEACTPAIDCPLTWLTMGKKDSPTAVQNFTVSADGNGGSVVIEFGNAAGTTAPRWDGTIEIVNEELGTQSVTLTYNESPEGRWQGHVYYFSTFGDRDLDGWQADRDNQVALNKVGNALVRRWGAFRVGNISFEEFQAVLQSTRNESWRWATVEADCTASQGACYPYDINQLGLVVYTSSTESNPIPTGAVEFPIAMNLRLPDSAGGPGYMAGRIESSKALQYAGDPAIELDFGVSPATCERTSGGACLVLLDTMKSDILLGGRYETSSSDSSCSLRPNGSFVLAQTPWLVPGFERSTELDSDTGLRYRYECRDSLLPFAPATAAELTDAMAAANKSLALSNPVADGRTRRRTLSLIDGALINQKTLFILFEETFESFLPGDTEPFSAYGYMILERQEGELDTTTDDDGNAVPDVYDGNNAEDTRIEPSDVLGLTCDPDLVKTALGDATQTKVTSANAAKVAFTLLSGRRPASTEKLITSSADERVHYLCGSTGLFDGGSQAATEIYSTLTNSDSCGYAASSDNHYDANGSCDDGGPDAETAICPIGTDKTDCGTRSAKDGDFREECPIGSDVTFFTLDSSVSQSDIADEDCQLDGSCGDSLEEWIASGKVVQLDPVWRCTDVNAVFCDSDRYDLRSDKSFYAKSDVNTVFQDLNAEVNLAFRYKTQFEARDGDTPGFVPEICNGDSRAIPYCYDPDRIEELALRVDCLLAIWQDHYATLQSATGDTAGADDALTDFLCSNFAYAEACVTTDDPTAVHDGFERLFVELLVMLGDEAYTQAFASRFDLAGKNAVSFEGSLFEDNGINLSGAAGNEMMRLYEATQYHQEALDRFYRQSPLFWESLGYGFDQRNFVSPETVTRYFERLVRASTQKARAWGEIAKRYQGFNRADLARKVVARAYTATYVESIVLSQLMLRTVDVLQPEDRPQVVTVLEEAQRRYRMAMSDMQNVYIDIADEVRYFGLAPEYIPFPSINPGPQDSGVEVMLLRAKQKLDVARQREDGAIERSKAFESDQGEFQSELVRLRNTYENQLGDLCGTFVGPEGKIYPAIAKYAELDDRLKTLGDPCGFAGNGTIYEAMANFEIVQTDLRRIRTSYSNVLEEVAIEKSRVEAQCGLILDNADYVYEKKGDIVSLQHAVSAGRFALSALDRTMNRASTMATLSKCMVVAGTSAGSDCPAGVVAALTYGTLATVATATAVVTEGAIAVAEGAIREIELDLGRWEMEQQCDSALIESNARMATSVLRLEEMDVEAMRIQYQVNLALAEIQQQLNNARRLQDDLVEAQDLAINIAAARNDPNVRIYRDDAIVNAELAFNDAIKEAYRATRVFEYYSSRSYADLEQLFLIRMVQYGDYNLQNYVTNLENAFFEFEEAFGLQDTRVALLSLRDDIMGFPRISEDGTPYTQDDRTEMMRERLKDPGYLDESGYVTIPFRTSFDELSPLTRVHKIDWIEANLEGSGLGDSIARIYLRQKGTAVVHGVDGDKLFYRFPERVAVVNPGVNGKLSSIDSQVYKALHLRDRPYVNTAWEFVINQRDEYVNQDIDLQGLTDIKLYVYYRDFTAL
ncbi:MAG: hypothetical protein IV100_22260 [Myxococcales bacterium]|nr:hypothetical protein [Myxococcales bacterium]